jgi:hypothetical protein
MEFDRDRLGEWIAKKAAQGILILGALVSWGFWLYAGFLLVVQILNWARTGAWITVPFAELLIDLGVDLTPVYYPQDWVGLASIATWILNLPQILVLFVCGLAGYAIIAILMERMGWWELID